jgi:hypothetical protein
MKDIRNEPSREIMNSWSSLRATAYGQLNQFELITDDAINGTTAHLNAIKAIKAKYPKPEQV